VLLYGERKRRKEENKRKDQGSLGFNFESRGVLERG